jgi:hypothetical protein
MGDVLRVLVLEDRPEDAELTVYQLRRAGFALEWSLVDTRAGFEAGSMCQDFRDLTLCA